MTFSIEMQEVVCGRCALSYAVPVSLFEIRKAGGQPMRCPGCGRRNWLDKVHPVDIESRREKVRQLHEQEQAEARATEAALKATPEPAAGSEAGDIPAEWPVPPEPGKLAAADYNRRNEWGRRVCPHCDKTYVNSGCYGSHLRHVHGIEPATGGAFRRPFAKA